jgi:uroporphyrinogen decarboxylase
MAWGHDFLAEWSPTDLAASTVGRARRLGLDIVKLQPRASCFAEAFGSGYGPSGTALEGPRLGHWPIDGFEGWSNLPEVDASHPSLADQVDALAGVVESLGDERPVLQTVFSPFTVASYVAADDRAESSRKRPDLIAKDQSRAVRHLRARPDVLDRALARISVTLIDFVRRSLNAGADGIFFAIGGSASSDALAQSEYEELVLPHDLAVLEAIPVEVPIVLHLCGPRLNFGLTAALRSDAVSWAATEAGNPGLAEGRDRSGRVAIGGVPEVSALAEGSSEDIRRAVRAAIDETEGRGVVVGPGCSIPPATPEENLLAMVEAAHGVPPARSRS